MGPEEHNSDLVQITLQKGDTNHYESKRISYSNIRTCHLVEEGLKHGVQISKRLASIPYMPAVTIRRSSKATAPRGVPMGISPVSS